MVQKWLVLFVALLIFLGWGGAVACAESEERQVRVFFDGEEISFRVAPQFQNNRLFVPVRPLLEALGTQVYWNQEKNTLSTTVEGKNIVVHLKQSMVEIVGNMVESDTPVVVVGGATMLPLRSFSELLGLKVRWDGENNIVEIESGRYVPFLRVKDDDNLPLAVRQWLEVSKPEEVNAALELEDCLYILSSMGWKPTAGYSVKIRRIERENSSFRVNVEIREPLPGQFVFQVISYPYDLVSLDLKAVGRPSAINFQQITR